jgi:hypothetical protein
MTTAQPAAGSDGGHGAGDYFDRLWRPRPLSGTMLGSDAIPPRTSNGFLANRCVIIHIGPFG